MPIKISLILNLFRNNTFELTCFGSQIALINNTGNADFYIENKEQFSLYTNKKKYLYTKGDIYYKLWNY